VEKRRGYEREGMGGGEGIKVIPASLQSCTNTKSSHFGGGSFAHTRAPPTPQFFVAAEAEYLENKDDDKADDKDKKKDKKDAKKDSKKDGKKGAEDEDDKKKKKKVALSFEAELYKDFRKEVIKGGLLMRVIRLAGFFEF